MASPKQVATPPARLVPTTPPDPQSVVNRNVILSDPDGEVAEALHGLRARIQTRHIEAGRRALAICGPTPEVGCSFIAVNLAVALAQIGVKTLLIDGDLRTPSVHTYFNPHLKGPGLAECLRSSGPAVDFTNQDVLPNLDVLIAGEVNGLTHELLAGERFPDLINICLRDYDLTIVDTPPANSCADGLRISTILGFSLIVARKSRTLVSDVKILADQLKNERVQTIGTVLNSF